jgi:hypothetical protein
MKNVVTSERAPVLADASTLEQFKEGRDTGGEYRQLIPARGEGGRAVAYDAGGRVEFDFIKREAKFFTIDAAARRDDRLTRFSVAVLRLLVEMDAH